MNPLTATGIIIIAPILAVAILTFLMFRRNHSKRITKRYMYLVWGFVFLTLFYIMAPDPSVIQSLYINQGDYSTPLTWSIIGATLLFVCIYVFKKHEDS